jgi:hypothetical protein
MIVVKTISPAAEKKLLAQWFEMVDFDENSEGIPALEPEDDDEPSTLDESRDMLSDVDTDRLLNELRKRDPSNPF